MRHMMCCLSGAVFALGLLVFAGCGGGSSPESPDTATSSYTTASVTITWPERVKSLPYLAESLNIQITGLQGFHVTHTANRPAAGGRAVISITNVPVGQVTVSLMAYPQANAGGTPLAQGRLLLTAHAGEELQIPVALNSTIDHLELSPEDAAFPGGTSQQFTVSAWNADGDWVPIALRNVSWISSDISVATVSENGLVTGVRPGRVLITATEAETRMIASIGVTITDEHVSVQPTALTLDIGESDTFTAQVTGLASNAVVWSIDEAPDGGAINPYTGAYTAPLATGAYHVLPPPVPSIPTSMGRRPSP